MSFTLFIITLFFAPLAFGSTEYWSVATVELLVAITGLVFFFPFPKKEFTFYKPAGFLPLLLLTGWMLLQCIPLPAPLVRLISPHTYEAYQPLLDVRQTMHFIPLTVHLKASLQEFLRIGSYLIFYILTVQLLTRRKRLLTTIKSISFLTLFIALLAIGQKLTAPHTIFWFRHLAEGKTAMGPWVYANHYAGFMIMLCPVLLSLLFYYQPGHHHRDSLRVKIVTQFSHQYFIHQLLIGLGVVLILASIAFSFSRGGILSITFTLALFIGILTYKQNKTSKITLLFLLTSVIVFMIWISWEPIVHKFNFAFGGPEGGIREDRFLVWKDAMAIFRDFPITGSGFGTFIDIFPGYKTIPDKLLYEHAHNDFVELLISGGLIGFSLAAWFVLSVLKVGIKRYFQRRDSFAVMIIAGTFSGITGILFYGLTDFNLQNGANGLYFFFLCGLLVSVSNTRRHYRTYPTLLPPVRLRYTRITAFLLTTFFLILLLVTHTGTIMADRLYRQANTISASSQSREEKINQLFSLLSRAKRLDPINGQYAYTLGNIEKYRYRDKKTLQNYIDAAMDQPMEGAFLQAVGLMLANSMKHDKALALLEAGYRRDDKNFIHLERWVDYLLSCNKRTEAIHILHGELERYPVILDSFYPLLRNYSFSQQEIIEVLPKRTYSLLRYGQLAQKDGDREGSRYYFEHALDYLGNEPKVMPHYFTLVYRYYLKQKQEDKAIATLRQGIQWLPNHANFHLQLGDYYKREGTVDKGDGKK